MLPVLRFAIFAEGFVSHEHGLDLTGIYERSNAIFPKEIEGYEPTVMRLFVGIFADTGEHTLKCTHKTTSFVTESSFEILPEHGFSFLQVVERDFPVSYAWDPILNEYPLFVDDLPLGAAYLWSHQY